MTKKYKKKSVLRDERGSISYWFIFVLLIIMLSFLFGVSIPFLQTYTVSIHGATDDLIDKAYSSAERINDDSAKEAIQSSLTAQKSALLEQQEIYSTFIQYSTIMIIIIIDFILFMASRRDVEQGIG